MPFHIGRARRRRARVHARGRRFGQCRRRGAQLRKRMFVSPPRARGGNMNGGVAALQPPPPRRDGVGALRFGQQFDEPPPQLRAEGLRGAAKRPVHLFRRAEEHGAQHKAQRAPGVALRVGDREGRAPRAADNKPALDAERLANALDVRHQARRVVIDEAQPGLAQPRAALIEQNGAKDSGVERPRMGALAAAARPAVEKDRRNAAAPPELFEIDRVARVHAQAPPVERLRLRMPLRAAVHRKPAAARRGASNCGAARRA